MREASRIAASVITDRPASSTPTGGGASFTR